MLQDTTYKSPELVRDKKSHSTIDLLQKKLACVKYYFRDPQLPINNVSCQDMNQSTDSNDTTPLPKTMQYWVIFYRENLKTYDHVLAWIFILGTVAGVLGNSCSVCYFWPRKKKTIHDMLYLSISAVDLITVSSIFPLIASLSNDRHPGILFSNKVFCGVWISLVILTTEMSIFLAMAICVTRTMIMKYPKHTINRSMLIGAIIGYFVFLVLFDMIYILNGWTVGEYYYHVSSCWLDYSIKTKYAMYLGIFLQAVTLFVPSLIIFVCFIVGIRILLNKPTISGENRKGFRRVSITISIFTAVFLFYNTPCFIKQIWTLAEAFGLNSPYDIFSNVEGGISYLSYVELLTMILPMFLNAVTNPLLYILRMREYQNWIRLSIKNMVQRFSRNFYNSAETGADVETAETTLS